MGKLLGFKCSIHSVTLSYCNGALTHNHLVRKQTLNHLAKLAKWLSCVVSTYLYGAMTVFGNRALAGRVLWIRSVFPSFRPSFFLTVLAQNWLIRFFWNFVWCSHMEMCMKSSVFLKKPPSSKNDQKRPKNGGFGVFRKICSLVFACKFCRMKVLMTKNCIWTKIWFSRYGQKCCQPIRFQYSLIINISLMDWHLALIFCMWINSLSGQTGRFWPKNGTSS